VIVAAVATLIVHFTVKAQKTQDIVRSVKTGLNELYFVVMMVYTCVVLNGKDAPSREDAVLIMVFAVIVVFGYTLEIVRGYTGRTN
jgi:quinol-cytochrome oxidoreductase complex cytochrome b subunit